MMPFNASAEHDHAAQLYELIGRLRADEDWSRRVGEAGHAMFREHLTRETVLLYWRTLISGACLDRKLLHFLREPGDWENLQVVPCTWHLGAAVPHGKQTSNLAVLIFIEGKCAELFLSS